MSIARSNQAKVGIEEITLGNPMRFRIDSELADYLQINSWASTKELFVALLKFDKKTKGDFYDKNSKSFNTKKYHFF